MAGELPDQQLVEYVPGQGVRRCGGIDDPASLGRERVERSRCDSLATGEDARGRDEQELAPKPEAAEQAPADFQYRQNSFARRRRRGFAALAPCEGTWRATESWRTRLGPNVRARACAEQSGRAERVRCRRIHVRVIRFVQCPDPGPGSGPGPGPGMFSTRLARTLIPSPVQCDSHYTSCRNSDNRCDAGLFTQLPAICLMCGANRHVDSRPRIESHDGSARASRTGERRPCWHGSGAPVAARLPRSE